MAVSIVIKGAIYTFLAAAGGYGAAVALRSTLEAEARAHFQKEFPAQQVMSAYADVKQSFFDRLRACRWGGATPLRLMTDTCDNYKKQPDTVVLGGGYSVW